MIAGTILGAVVVGTGVGVKALQARHESFQFARAANNTQQANTASGVRRGPRNRVAEGVPTGGQFAARDRAQSDVSLGE